MRRYTLILFLIGSASMMGDHPMSAQEPQGDPCPVKYRKDPVAAGRAREAKKQRMRENRVPERYLHLLDKMECVACIETAPDTLHITVLYHDDEHAPTLSTGERDLKVEFKWNAQSERQLREELRAGKIRAFYVWIHEKRCNCCPDLGKTAESYADWDDDIGANMDETEQYDDPDDLGPLPDDLKPPPPGSQTPPPPIERFDDLPRPSRRVLQATCQPCEELARQWTNESNNLNFLWDRKIEQMRRVSVIANARANRSNEIQRLEYEQRFDSTRSYDNLQTIKELKEVNEAQEADQEKAESEIERLDQEIRETEMRMEELMQKFLECEKACRKTTTATAAGTADPIVNETPAAIASVPTAPSIEALPDLSINTSGSSIDPRLPDTPVVITNADDGVVVDSTNSCSGAECAEEWNACTTTNSCTPIDRDCGVPGTCSSASADLPNYNLTDPSTWSSSANADVEQRIQIKFGDVFLEVVIRPVQPAKVDNWFNPLGLLARRLVDNVERWRGSMGPRPLITARDLREVEKYSSGQALGLPKGLHVLLTDRGGSTGKTLGMQILNLTGQPVRLASMPFAIEPIRQQAQARAQQAFNRLAKAAPVNIDLAGYCVEFLKLPPAANQIFRLAPASVQKKYEAMSKVLRSAYRVQHAGLLRPDSNPGAYTDSIKQWALWAVEQKFNESRFTDAFLGHTRKNIEAAGQPWSKPAEDMIRKVSPNRWRDIVKVLTGAGLAVPQ